MPQDQRFSNFLARAPLSTIYPRYHPPPESLNILLYSKLPLYRSRRDPLNYFDITGLRYKEFDISEINFQTDLGFRYKHINQCGNTKLI